MKANELRIGNWIRASVTKKEFTASVREINYLQTKPDVFEGIPITSEWLGKLGFEDKDSVFYCRYNKEICLVDDENDGRYVVSDGGNELLNPVIYVHQLQNLYFALYQSELQETINK